MIDAIIEFVTTYHEGGRHGGMYGWVYVLAVAISIGSVLAARELLERRERLLKNLNTRFANGPLTAAAVVEQNGRSRTIEGKVRTSGGTYELTLCESTGSTQFESIHTFSSIE
ncbi:MAG: hypothetical protein IE917_09970 [Betaproteobacteria bacterium]|nr:hypothetical protein [Betaproteobacteria bacterium]